MTQTPPKTDYPSLARRTSRWQTRAAAAGVKTVEKVGDRYNVLLYLKGIEAEGFESDSEEPAAKKIKIGPESKATEDVCRQLCAALKSSRKIASEKEVVGSGKGRRVRKVNILGNRDAHHLIRETDELASLARTVYADPNDLEDWIQNMFEARFRNTIVQLDVTKRSMLQRSLDWSDRWAEVRYRFMNHYMRDDPTEWRKMSSGANRAAGDNANAITHEARIQEDCFIAESKWFTDEYRDLFRLAYGLTVDRAILLNHVSVSSALSNPIRGVFAWCIETINRFVDWRLDVLRRAVRFIREDPEFRGAGATAQELMMDKQQQSTRTDFSKIDNAYNAYVKAVRVLAADSAKTSKMSASLYQALANAVRNLTLAIHAFPTTKYSCLGPRFVAMQRRWPNHRDDTPRFPTMPQRPTILAF